MQINDTIKITGNNTIFLRIIIIIVIISFWGCSSAVRYSSDSNSINPKTPNRKENTTKNINEVTEKLGETLRMNGMASYYSDKFQGQRTSSGELYDKDKLTAAHPELPFGTIVEVRNISNNRKVRVKINDRGPFIAGRIIDLSRAAANAIGMIQAGVIEVEITIISIP